MCPSQVKCNLKNFFAMHTHTQSNQLSKQFFTMADSGCPKEAAPRTKCKCIVGAQRTSLAPSPIEAKNILFFNVKTPFWGHNKKTELGDTRSGAMPANAPALTLNE